VLALQIKNSPGTGLHATDYYGTQPQANYLGHRALPCLPRVQPSCLQQQQQQQRALADADGASASWSLTILWTRPNPLM